MNLEEFIASHGLSAFPEEIPARTDGIVWDNEMAGTRHFAIELRSKETGNAMRFEWSQGPGIQSPPVVDDVLESLILDASNVGYADIEDARSFEDWADDLGLDSDSRKALATYQLVIEQTAKLSEVLGADAWEEVTGCVLEIM